MRTQSLPLLAAALAIAGCSQPAPDAPNATEALAAQPSPAAPGPAPTATVAARNDLAAAAPLDPAALAGRWIGVEGTYLVVTPTGGSDVSLEMQWDLDHKGVFPGSVGPDGIRFTRDGETLMLKPSDGDATGLKWLAGKRDCLTVKSGEGYCRA